MHIYLVHCWDAYTTQNGVKNWHPPWYDWLAAQFSDISFTILRMPHSNTPKINEWVTYLDEVIPFVDENTVLIGHSIGCQTIMRYIEKKKIATIGGVYLVAGWFDLTNLETDEARIIAKPWIETAINFSTLAPFRSKFHVFLSDDDKFVELEPNKDLFEKHVSDDVTIMHAQGHFDETQRIQLLLEKIKKLKN